MLPVYQLTLRQLSGRWRLAIMTVLAAMPVLITVLILRDDDTGSVSSFENSILSTMLAGSIIPLVVLAIASAAFSNEVEDRTLANLTISPLARWRIALPKLLGTITIALPFIAVSAFLTAHIAFMGEWTATFAVVASPVVAVAMYASLFTYLGLVSTQAIGIGLLYIVLWEGLFSGYVAGARLFSIRFYSIAFMHGLDERRFALGNTMGMVAAVVMATLVIGGFLWLTVRHLRRMDVP